MRRVRLVRSSPIAEFARIVSTHRDEIFRVWLITPWIGRFPDGSTDPLQVLIDSLRGSRKCMVTVITQEPGSEASRHKEALRLLRENVGPTLFFCDSLHTKLYVAETGGMVTAMIGSPNLNPGGNSVNKELALELRTTSRTRSDDVSSAVYDLLEYAEDLLGDDSVRIAN